MRRERSTRYRWQRLAATTVLFAVVIVGTITRPIREAGAATQSPPTTVVDSWGDNDVGELGTGTLGPSLCTQQFCSTRPVEVDLPTGATPASVAGGYWNGFVLTTDHRAFGWGFGSYGSIGDGTWQSSSTPQSIPFPGSAYPIQIAGADYFAVARMSDGSVTSWGYGDDGELGNCGAYPPGPHRSNSPEPVVLPVGVSATQVSAWYRSAAIVGSDGKLYAWGPDLGSGDCPTPLTLPSGSDAVAVSIGSITALALDAHGGAYFWDKSSDLKMAPAILPGGVTAAKVFAVNNGDLAFMIGTDGNLYEWQSWPPVQAPTLVNLPPGVKALNFAEDGISNLVLGSDGNAYAWGGNYLGTLGDGTTSDNNTPTAVIRAPGTSVIDMAAGGFFNMEIASVGLAPGITTPATAPFASGNAGQFTIQAPGSPTPVVSIGGKLPRGLSFTDNGDGTATISGTPSGSTEKSVIVTARNANGTASETLQMIVGSRPSVTSASATFRVGVTHTATIAAKGSPSPQVGIYEQLPPLGFSPVPSGLTLSDGGLKSATLSGTPLPGTGGDYQWSSFASNALGVVVAPFSIVIDEAPTFNSGASVSFSEGSSNAFDISTTEGYPGPVKLALRGSLPSGVQFVDHGDGTGMLSGTPIGLPGNYSFTIIAANAYALTKQPFTLTVTE